MDLEAIDDRLVSEKVVIWWNDGTATGIRTQYEGKLVSAAEDGPHNFKVQYTCDDTEEYMNLCTLEVLDVDEGAVHNMGRREVWMLESYQGSVMDHAGLLAQLETDGAGNTTLTDVLDGDASDNDVNDKPTPNVASTQQKKQHKNTKNATTSKTHSQEDTATQNQMENEEAGETSSTVGLDRRRTNIWGIPLVDGKERRTKRLRTNVVRYDVDTDGANDTTRKRKPRPASGPVKRK